jgi:hypothetical protein
MAPSDTTSVTTAISRAPRARHAAASGARSTSCPNTLGFCTTTQDVSASISDARSSAATGCGAAATAVKPPNRAWVSTTAR